MFIHVTHNQEEALSMADRIVVMNEARIQQIADPLTIATRPETELVARFMGDNNIIRGRVMERNGDRLLVADEHNVQSAVVALFTTCVPTLVPPAGAAIACPAIAPAAVCCCPC